MTVIYVLPPEVATKIAAGEVVERPASVVKELLDNAIDAGADRIVVELENGGQDLIRVIDNGCGMSREDARLAVERHATSKIRTAEDLDAIVTFGFRGEALASIAAVSKFELITRRTEDLEGTRLFMEGTVEPALEPIGCPTGTTVTASDLYFNTPARRKFLKTPSTELAHSADMFNRAALPHQDIHFTLRHNGRTIQEYPRVKSREERLYAFLGKDVWESIRKVSDETVRGASDEAEIQIEGFVSLPTESRNRADQLLFFVNDRYVQNRMMMAAVMEAYRRLIHPGRYPVVALFLYVDPATIDINVHPKKQEIKFADEQKVWRLIHATIRESLSRLEQDGARVTIVQPERVDAPLLPIRPVHPPVLQNSSRPEPALPPAPGLRKDEAETIHRAMDRFFEKTGLASESSCESPASDEPIKQPITEPEPAPALFERADKPIPLAQVLHTYLICEQDNQMVLIDQHAAAERIRYEQLKRQIENGAPRQQALLFPITIEVPPGEAPLLEEHLPLLKTFGFDLEPFGQNTFSVSAIPALFQSEDCEQLVKDLIKEFSESGASRSLEQIRERVLITLACHHSIRAGQRLSPESMQDLIDQLFKSPNPHTCPHGRPTMITLKEADLERMFKRSGF